MDDINGRRFNFPVSLFFSLSAYSLVLDHSCFRIIKDGKIYCPLTTFNNSFQTTAARPTFDPARGNDNKAPSFQYGARDLASHTKLKFRQPGQGTADEIGSREELLAELREAERKYFEEKEGKASSNRLIKQDGENNINEEKQKLLAEAERLAKLDKEDTDEESENESR